MWVSSILELLGNLYRKLVVYERPFGEPREKRAVEKQGPPLGNNA